MESKDDDYWNDSTNKSFNFDEDEVAVLEVPTSSTAANRRSLFGEDTSSEVHHASTQQELPLSVIISDEDLASLLEDQSRNEVPLPKGISSRFPAK